MWILFVSAALGWDPLPVVDDPLVRLPGTQPDSSVSLESPNRCLNCHADYATTTPGSGWRGSMMAQAARDPLFWAAVAVTAQDSVWAVGRPNATDVCLRCHLPEGWLEGRSDPTNGSGFTGSDFDGVHCDVCHRMVDPQFADTHAGLRDGSDWTRDFDEAGPLAGPRADATRARDALALNDTKLFSGLPAYAADRPTQPGWTEATGGQFFVDVGSDAKRAAVADDAARHGTWYSRFHRSRWFCGTCHDVGNPVLANLAFEGTPPGDGTTVLPSESAPSAQMPHVERTFSEFILSDYGQIGGTAGSGAFAPDVFTTSRPGNLVGSCQDCHMADRVGQTADKRDAPIRPTESDEHPHGGLSDHRMVGGNAWIPRILASTVSTHDAFDPVVAGLLGAGPNASLTLDLTQGQPLDAQALQATALDAEAMLGAAATLEDLTYDAATGVLSLRVVNHTGHKLPTGFPEGRRLWIEVQAWSGTTLLDHVNPYDDTVSTLVGLDPVYAPDSPPAGPGQRHEDALVYEVVASSSLLGTSHTLHIALADGRWKDNRIPPRGFRVQEAVARHAEPVVDGQSALDRFGPDALAGGYDDVVLVVAPGADRVEVRAWYQTTSREFVGFLRDELLGTATTLPSPTPSGEPQAYIAQTDPWFAALKDWGPTIWDLWDHTRTWPGAAPVRMTEASWRCEEVDADGDGFDACTDCDDGDASVGACPVLEVPDPFVAGQPGTITIWGADPGADLTLLRGRAGRTAPAPGCPDLILDLGSPRILTTRTADAAGTASLTATPPANLAGREVAFQAVDLVGCTATQVEVRTFATP